LAQDLWLTEYQGVEPAGDTHQVFYRIQSEVAVEIGHHPNAGESMKTADPVCKRFVVLFIEDAVDLGSVAGGENNRLFDRWILLQTAKRTGNDIGTKCHLFPDLYRGGFVIES
jgi:hypothetical protein